MLGIDALPGEQEALKLRDGDGLNLGAQALNGQPMNAREETAVAPFQIAGLWTEFAAKDESLPFQGEQGLVDFGARQIEELSERSGGDWADDFHASAQKLAKSIGAFPFLLRF